MNSPQFGKALHVCALMLTFTPFSVLHTLAFPRQFGLLAGLLSLCHAATMLEKKVVG